MLQGLRCRFEQISWSKPTWRGARLYGESQSGRSAVKNILLIVVRIALSLLGAVAAYVLLYGGTAWLADSLGYESAFGRGLGFVNGALSPLGGGYIAIV